MRDRGSRRTVAVHQARVPREDDPAGGRLADDLAQLHRAIALGEVLRVRQRVLVGHEHGRLLERALAERRPRRRRRHAALRHVQVVLAREHVERVGVDEAAVVVADVDDDAVARDVVGVEIDVELRERSGRHVGHVHVAEPAVARLRHVVAPFGSTHCAVAQPALGRRGRSAGRPRRAPPSPARSARRVSTVRRLILFSSSASRLTRGADRRAVDGRAGSRPAWMPGRARPVRAAIDVGDLQAARLLVLRAIEVEPEVADAAAAGAAAGRRVDAHVRRVQLADHQRRDAAASRRACARRR